MMAGPAIGFRGLPYYSLVGDVTYNNVYLVAELSGTLIERASITGSLIEIEEITGVLNEQ